MELVLPSEKYKKSYLQAAKEFLAEGEGNFGEDERMALNEDDFEAFIEYTEKRREESQSFERGFAIAQLFEPQRHGL